MGVTAHTYNAYMHIHAYIYIHAYIHIHACTHACRSGVF